MALTHTSREQIEVHRFSVGVTAGVPLIALVLQAFIPLKVRFFSVFDLPLLVTIFFAVARRSQVTGMLTGAVIGLLQDGLAAQPLGIYGIAKTVVGYGASSLGVRIDVDNPGSRMLMTWFFYLVHRLAYFLVAHSMVGRVEEWRWGYSLGAGLANGLLAVVVFAVLDRFKQRA